MHVVKPDEVMSLTRTKTPAGLFGVGTDIIEIGRIKRAFERSGVRFLEKIFTPGEMEFCEMRKARFSSYAARFAAKEAVLKALGTGMAGCSLLDVEVTRPGGGRPEIVLHGAAAAIAKEKGIASVLISISHNRDQAVAFAIATGKEVL
jgi:holo-[acyl-carrier protein] synthase